MRKVSAIERQAVAFTEEQRARFVIDRFVVTCQPRDCRVPSRAIPRLGELKQASFVRRDRGAAVRIEKAGLVLVQELGHHSGGRGNLSCRVEANVNARLCARLTSMGLYRAPRGSSLMGDNFIDPARLDSMVDVHTLALDEVLTIIAEARLAYADNLRELFGVKAVASAVAVSISEIELTWDAPCRCALWAPKLWWQSWADSFLDARTGPGPMLAELPTVHQSFGLSSGDLHSMSGSRVLHGRKAEGERFKLYPKHDQLLRYEATFDGVRARARLGRPIRIDNRQNLEADLTRLANLAYAPLMSVRQDLLASDELSPGDVLEAFARAGRKPERTRAIFDAFVAGNVFHNPEERYSRELTRLRRMNWVRLVGRGRWAPTGSLRRYLAKMYLVWTHAEHLDIPTGRGTTPAPHEPFVSGPRAPSTQLATHGLASRKSTRTRRGVSTHTPEGDHAA